MQSIGLVPCLPCRMRDVRTLVCMVAKNYDTHRYGNFSQIGISADLPCQGSFLGFRSPTVIVRFRTKLFIEAQDLTFCCVVFLDE